MPVDHSPSREGSGHSTASTRAANMENGPQVNKIAFRAPPFWPSDPELWFIHLEEQFSLSGITQDSTKFSHVLAQLDLQTSQEIRDILLNPPAEDRYEALKNALIRRLATSQEQRIRKLLEHEELGDRRPSQFLRHLRSLAGTATSEELLRSLWLGRLPAQMQAILATRAQDPLNDVADQADRIQEASGYTVAAVAAPAQKQPTIEEQLQRITRRLEEMDRRFEKRQHSHERSQSRDRNRSRNRDSSATRNKELCFYHQKYGKKAKKCEQPCTFKASNNRGNH